MIPTEYQEQVAFIRYLELKGYDYFHVPNSTYTKSWNQKRLNKALGVKPGVPDIFVIVEGDLITVEMKRVKGGRATQAQLDWIKKLNSAGIPSKVCRGAQEAIEFVESYE